jgi:hypothetical protein
MNIKLLLIKCLLFLINLATLTILIPLTSISILVGHFLHPIKYLKNIKEEVLKEYNNEKSSKIAKCFLAFYACIWNTLDFFSLPIMLLPSILLIDQVKIFNDKTIFAQDGEYNHSLIATIRKNFSEVLLPIKGEKLYVQPNTDLEYLNECQNSDIKSVFTDEAKMLNVFASIGMVRINNDQTTSYVDSIKPNPGFQVWLNQPNPTFELFSNLKVSNHKTTTRASHFN